MGEDERLESLEGTQTSHPCDDLSKFLDRLVRLGVVSLQDVSFLTNDPALASQIVNAAHHNPLEGTRTSIDLLERELKEQALLDDAIINQLTVLEEDDESDGNDQTK
jgi:hypothetical protein